MKTFEGWQTRVIDEKEALEEKLVKLNAFIKGDAFKALPAEQRSLFGLQKKAMMAYFNVLKSRIRQF